MSCRVLYFVSIYQEGTTASQARMILAQSRYGRCSYIAIGGEKEQHEGLHAKLMQAGIEHYIVRGLDRRSRFFELCREVGRIIALAEPDIVHVHSNWQLALVTEFRRQAKRPFRLVYSMHGYRNHQPLKCVIARPLIELGLKHWADQVIFPSQVVWRRFGNIQRKSVVVYHAIGDEYYGNWDAPDFTGLKRIVFVGKFRDGKNQEWLIRALKRYVDRTGDRSVRLHLVGEGPRLPFCRAVARRLGLEETVVFTGFLSPEQVLKQYLSCQFAVVPSRDETFGYCIAEPFVLGRVVFTRPVGVAGDIIRHGVTGFLFDTEDQLAELLVRYLPKVDLCTQVSCAARERGVIFQLKKLALETESIYENVASGEACCRD